MNEISAKYFSTKFITENKLKLADIVILEYIYSWVLSDRPPESKMESGKKVFYLSQTHIASDYEGLIDQSTISRKLKKLEKCGVVETRIIDSVRGKFYMGFNWDKVVESMAPRELLEQQKYKYCSNWFEKIFQYMKEEKQAKEKWDIEWNKKSFHERIQYQIDEERKYKEELELESYNKNMNSLLDKNDMQVEKPKYCVQADAIAKKILSRYGNYFSNRVPKENEKPTKTYARLCRKIEDIYNGSFTNSRFYIFDDAVFENKQFETDGWREKIKDVKGDWKKVRQLIFSALDNFVLMYDEQRMPMNKDFLTTNLSEWFFSDNPNNKGQSQFIQSLNEPMIQKEKLGLDKARNMIENIKKKSPVAYQCGHELNELLPVNANEVTAWKFISKIIKWGDLLNEFDDNAKYFLQAKINGRQEGGGKVLPALFARYLKENKISVSLSTLNIEKSVDNNAPWRWFVEDACRKHEMNMDFVQCFNEDDFYDACKITGNIVDDVEIPVF